MRRVRRDPLGDPGQRAAGAHGGLSLQHVSAGFHSCGLTTGGAAYCWGLNYFGKLGNGTITWGEASPVAVAGGHAFQSLSAGYGHSCGATAENDAYCWGWNNSGQVGDGTYTNQPLPVFVLDLDPPTP